MNRLLAIALVAIALSAPATAYNAFAAEDMNTTAAADSKAAPAAGEHKGKHHAKHAKKGGKKHGKKHAAH